ncbi:hypothetical protein GCM10007111_27210 [Virgibacillus kapii]|uniref:Uncharacterized protein n=1 Tax=Virgibacillus kapii TaxID=1638645 RepID=A0ABQ2DMY8_9BACI|nr:hypothetical protein GCM10007111_27210 [Virgibacillus kapii]
MDKKRLIGDWINPYHKAVEERANVSRQLYFYVLLSEQLLTKNSNYAKFKYKLNFLILIKKLLNLNDSTRK